MKDRKVSYIGKDFTNLKPYIRLQGNWLKEAGFNINDFYFVEVRNNKITLIKKLNEGKRYYKGTYKRN